MEKYLKKIISAGTILIASANPTSAFSESSNNKGTFVLVHSAFTGSWAMESLAKNLRSKGFKVILPELPAHGNDKTLAKNVQFSSYVNTVLSNIDKQDNKVILLGHSFAGTIISEVAEQRPDKIQSLVYLAGALIPSGTSFIENLNGVKSVLTENMIIDSENGVVTIGNQKTHEAYAEDVPLEEFKNVEKDFVPEPLAPLSYKINLTKEKFGTIPKYYIQTLNDKAIPQSLQRKMYTDIPVKQVFTIDSSHAPNLSNPNKVSDILTMINSIENNKVSDKVKYKVTKEIHALATKWENDFSLEAKSKKAKKIVDVYSNDAILQAVPASFGVSKGKENIRKFWQFALDSGASDMVYQNQNVLVLDENTAIHSANFSMNLFEGIITMERYVKIKNKWEIVEDNVEVTKFKTPEAK